MGSHFQRAFLTGAAVTILAGMAAAAHAGDKAPAGTPEGSIATSVPAIANPLGLRPALAARGITYEINDVAEVLGNPSGGMRQGTIFDNRLELVIDADLSKLAGWTGATVHVNAFRIDGHGLSTEYVGNIMAVSNIEATRATRLFEAWLEQKMFNDKVSVRAGQLAADSEFITSEYAGAFINGTFGWPALIASDLPNGGPAYPLATPGVRVQIDPVPGYSLLVGVFNGDPAGPGEKDPQRRNCCGVDFRTGDPAFVIAEQQFKYNQGKKAAGLPGTIKLGAWYHAGDFTDQFNDTRSHDGNHGFYAVLDQQIYRLPGKEANKGVGVFARLGAAPADRNEISFYADAGVNFAGMVPGRPDDVIGLAVGYAKVSGDARDADRAANPAVLVRDYEMAFELSYQAEIVPGWTLQPDLQYIIHPGTHSAEDTDVPGKAAPDAVVIGLRSTVKY